MRTTIRPVRGLAAVSVALLLSLPLAACGSDDPDEDTTTTANGTCESTVPAADPMPESAPADPGSTTRPFEADNGTVEIPTDPQRIVATGYAVPVLLEADADLVGISEWGRGTNLMTDEDLAEYERLKKVMGETADTVNYEAVANVRPDLIMLGVPLPVLGEIDMERLEAIAPVVVLGPTRPDSWKELSRRQTDAAGELDYYDKAKASYEAKAAELQEKYADVLEGHCVGHVGAYGDITAGNFQREYAGSWGTDDAGDVGAVYYGAPAGAEEAQGSDAVSETPSIEELPESFENATVITYTVDDGEPVEAVSYVLEHELWDTLPAVQDGLAIPIRYTEAATYPTAEKTLDEVDAAFAKAFADELG